MEKTLLPKIKGFVLLYKLVVKSDYLVQFSKIPDDKVLTELNNLYLVKEYKTIIDTLSTAS